MWIGLYPNFGQFGLMKSVLIRPRLQSISASDMANPIDDATRDHGVPGVPRACLRKDPNDRGRAAPARGSRFVHDRHIWSVERKRPGSEPEEGPPTRSLMIRPKMPGKRASCYLILQRYRRACLGIPESIWNKTGNLVWLVWPYADQSATDDPRDPQS